MAQIQIMLEIIYDDLTECTLYILLLVLKINNRPTLFCGVNSPPPMVSCSVLLTLPGRGTSLSHQSLKNTFFLPQIMIHFASGKKVTGSLNSQS